MAANSSCRGIASLGKQFVTQISAHHSARSLSAPAFRRSVNTSVYDKNVEDHVYPAAVPDDIIKPESDKYWAPNPHTGVFGPANDAAAGVCGFHTSPTSDGTESVLEQKAFFRPLEDLDKPQHP